MDSSRLGWHGRSPSEAGIRRSPTLRPDYTHPDASKEGGNGRRIEVADRAVAFCFFFTSKALETQNSPLPPPCTPQNKRYSQSVRFLWSARLRCGCDASRDGSALQERLLCGVVRDFFWETVAEHKHLCACFKTLTDLCVCGLRTGNPVSCDAARFEESFSSAGILTLSLKQVLLSNTHYSLL